MADGLFEQLRGMDEDGKTVARVSSHDLVAMVGEVRRNHVTGLDAKASLGLTDQSTSDIAAIISEVTAGNITGGEVRDVLDLTASRKPPYDVKANWAARLGI